MNERIEGHEAFDSEADQSTIPSEPKIADHGHDEENDHLASIYESRDGQFSTVVPFVREGLERSERCLYIADDNTPDEVLSELHDGGVDVDAAVDSGALSILTDANLETGQFVPKFDSNAQIGFWKDSLAEAKERERYAGVRVAVEMTWALDGETSLDRLVEYEAMLNTVFAGKDYTVLCQYKRDSFPPSVLSDVIRTHPLVAYDSTVCQNFYYSPPDEFLDPDTPRDVDRMVEGLLSRARTRETLRERERGLATLTDVTRELMQANPEEVCELVAETAQNVLESTVTAVWLSEEDDNLHLHTVRGSGATDAVALADRCKELARRTFAGAKSNVYNDFDGRVAAAASETPLRSGVLLPLGEHGAFMVASDRRNAFDATDVDFVKTVAANTEAMLDRAVRERTLQERECELGTRVRQQQTVTELGQRALENPDLDDLFDDAVEAVADTLGNDYCKVLELLPDERELRLRSGVGWVKGYVGHATVGTGDDSQAGYTLRSEAPVIVDDLSTDERFSGPELLTEHDVVSGISTIIGSFHDPWGVLGTHHTERREFTEDDVNFVQSVATILATAIERKQYEERINETVTELEQSNERLEQFASVISHDLRNPLAIAQMYLTEARNGDETADFDEVEKAHERMETIIQNLLTLAREGQAISETELVSLSTVAENAWQHVDTVDATLRVGDDRTMLADGDRLQAAFENLFRNAIEHGGRDVDVRIGRLDDASGSEVVGDSADESVGGFYVEDTGSGIPPESREEVFDYNYTASDGTGFGLAIVQEIVKAHGWEITVTDGTTGGVRFEIRGTKGAPTDDRR